tara:strand:- start:720 stop:1076 length:357 start_codon:yes stop_codon:yes gene_type:complete
LSEIRVTTISDTAGTGPVTLTKQHAAKAWAHTTDHTIDDSFNHSSSTDHGTGDYTLSFTNNMANNTFSSTANACQTGFRFVTIYQLRNSAGSHGLYIGNSSSAADDQNIMSQTHGDLA